MKLPGIEKGAVQSLGRESNARAQAVQAEGAADQALLNLGADVITEVAEITDKYELSKADVNLRTRMADLASEFEGQEYVDPMDPRLDEIDFKRENERGEIRERVPVHEVYAQLYENTARQALNESGAMISRPGSKDAWLATYGAQAEENIARQKVKAVQDTIKYQLTEQNTALKVLEDEGRWNAMDAALDNYIGSAEDKKAWKSAVVVGKETDRIATIAGTGSPNEMMEEAFRLRDPDQDYPFTQARREQLAKSLEASSSAKRDQDSRQVAHDWVLTMKRSGATDEEILAQAQNLPVSEVSDKAVSLMKSRMATEALVEKEALEQSLLQHDDAIRNNRMSVRDIPPDVWAKYSIAERDKLEQLERRLPSDISPTAYWNEKEESVKYMNLAYGTPEQRQEFAGMNIPKETMLWGDADREKIRALWRQTKDNIAAGNDPSKYDPAGATRTQIFNEYVQRAYGKQLEDLTRQEALQATKFSDGLDIGMEQIYKEKGRNATPNEIRDLARTLAAEEVLGKEWLFFDKTGPRFEKSIPGVPDNYLNAFIQYSFSLPGTEDKWDDISDQEKLAAYKAWAYKNGIE